MKNLLTEWRTYVLNEGIVKPQSLPEGVYVFVNTEDSPHEITFSFVDRNGSPIGDEISGTVRITLISEETENYYGGRCSDGYVVSFSNVESHWGGLLYDVAIEWASTRGTGNGLAPERDQVSDASREIWYNIFKHRHDIEMIQLDSPDNELTDSDEDNCAQNAAKSIAANTGAEQGEKNLKWYDTPISKLYKKKNPTFLEELEDLGKLIYREAG